MAKKYRTEEPFLEIREDGSELYLSYVSTDTGRIRKFLRAIRVKKNQKETQKLNKENLERRIQLIEQKVDAIESYLNIQIDIEDSSEVNIFDTKTIKTDYIIEYKEDV